MQPVQEEDVVTLSADGSDLRLRLFRPASSVNPKGCIIHIHGGGYIGGSLEAAGQRNRDLVSALGCLVIAVDYRLAPEHPYPAAIEDCYAALAWATRARAALGIDTGAIGIKGESAGGGLAAALALLARDRGDYRIDFQHLTYPMIDDRTGSERPGNSFSGQYVWTAQNNVFGWRSLLGPLFGGGKVPAYAAAARATDLSGLPPAFLMTGTLDLFFDENIEFARRFVGAGVPIEFHALSGAFHGFELATAASVSRLARLLSLRALARALGISNSGYE
jgi:triacylglycerol lipase